MNVYAHACRAVPCRIEPRIMAWKMNKGVERELPTLLSSLASVLWDGAQWRKVDMQQLLDQSGVRKVVSLALQSSRITNPALASGVMF